MADIDSKYTCSEQNRSFIQLQKGKTAYYLFGNTKNPKQLWVLIHGIGAYAYCFEWLINHLNTNSSIAQDALVLTFDLYGRGYSGYATPQNQGLFVGQTRDLLQTLNLVDFSSCTSPVKSPISPREKEALPVPPTPIPTFSFPPFKSITLVGHSMGGAISLCFCHAYPEVVESMILLSPAGGPFTLPAQPVSGVVKFLPVSAGSLLFSLVTQTVFPDTQIVTGDYFNLQNPASQKKIKHFINLRLQTINFKIFNESIIDALKNFPLNGCQQIIQDLGKLPKYAHVKTLIMWGFYDALVVGHQSFPFFHKAFENHPNACLLLVHNTRHDFMNERDSDVCLAIEKFIKNFSIMEETAEKENDKPPQRFKIKSSDLANAIRKDLEQKGTLFGSRPSSIGLLDKLAEKKLMKKFPELVV